MRYDLGQGFAIELFEEGTPGKEHARVTGPSDFINLDNASLQHLRAIMTAESKLTHYIAIGPNCWGRAESQEQAIRNMSKNHHDHKRPRHYSVYNVTRGTYVNDMGGFTRNGYDAEPVKVFSTEGLAPKV